MTLGRLIDQLTDMPQDEPIYFDFGRLRPGGLMSYRGLYERLALGFDGENEVKVSDLLAECRTAIGKTFTGYKGGDYVMDRDTLVHVANYGNTSETQIVRISRGRFCVLIETAHVDD